MAIELERLIATLEANFKSYDKALKKALGDTDKTFTRIEKRGKEMESRLSAIGGAAGRSLLGFVAGAASLRGAQQLIDTATRIDNSLKVAGLSGEELKAVYDRLFASAQRNAAPLEALVELYSRASLNAKDLGASQTELLNFTDAVSTALRVNGKSAEESSGALLQLSQLLGSGVVRAEEFNSVQEGALPILQAVAAGLKEAGGSVSALRNLVIEGKVSSEAFFRAFEAGAPILEQKLAGSTLTVDQAMQRLRNSLVDAAGKIDGVSGASRTAVDLLDRLAGAVNGLSNVFEAAANSSIGKFIGQLSTLNDLILKFLPAYSALGLLDEKVLNGIADSLGPSAGPANVQVAGGKGSRVVFDPVQSRIDGAFGDGSVTPVSLADFKAPSSKKGAKAKKTRENDYQREVAQIRERTAALQAETAAQASLNPLVDDYGFAVEKARAVQELLTAAQRAGIEITPELRAKIDELATGYADATVAAEKLAEKQDAVREAAEFFRDQAWDAFSSIIPVIETGNEALDNLLNTLIQVVAQAALLGTGPLGKLFGGGLLNQIIGGASSVALPSVGPIPAARPLTAAGGGKVVGPGTGRSDSIPARLSNGEFVVNARAARQHGPLLDAINTGATLRRMADGGMVGRGGGGAWGAPNVNFQIIEAGQEKAKVQSAERQPNGDVLVKMIIGEVKRDYGSGGFDKLNAGRFGLKPTVRAKG